MKKEFINPAGLSAPRGYTHVVSISSGKTVYVSGQVALDARAELVGRGDLRRQTEQVFENLITALAAAGAMLADVVKITYFVVSLKPEDGAIIREARSRYFGEKFPASTMVGVTALAMEGLLVEIEAIAAVD